MNGTNVNINDVVNAAAVIFNQLFPLLAVLMGTILGLGLITRIHQTLKGNINAEPNWGEKPKRSEEKRKRTESDDKPVSLDDLQQESFPYPEKPKRSGFTLGADGEITPCFFSDDQGARHE